VEQKFAALNKRLDGLESEADAALATLSSRISALESQVTTVQSNLTSVTEAGFIKRCRVCFNETEGSDQCQGSRSSCSGWSTSPSWTLEFRDDTNNRGGGCKYQWRVECQWTV